MLILTTTKYSSYINSQMVYDKFSALFGPQQMDYKIKDMIREQRKEALDKENSEGQVKQQNKLTEGQNTITERSDTEFEIIERLTEIKSDDKKTNEGDQNTSEV